jgi:hypothetical protein
MQQQQKAKKPNTADISRIHNICVYCGSGVGTNPAYAAAARELGQGIAAAGVGLVYGGGGLGLMGGLEAFIRPDMDVRFATVERVEEVLPTILAAAAAARSEPAAEAVSEKF